MLALEICMCCSILFQTSLCYLVLRDPPWRSIQDDIKMTWENTSLYMSENMYDYAIVGTSYGLITYWTQLQQTLTRHWLSHRLNLLWNIKTASYNCTHSFDIHYTIINQQFHSYSIIQCNKFARYTSIKDSNKSTLSYTHLLAKTHTALHI